MNQKTSTNLASLALLAYLLAAPLGALAGAETGPNAELHDGHSAADCALHAAKLKQSSQVAAVRGEISRRRRQATADGGTNLFSVLSELGPQVEKAQAINTLFGGGSSSPTAPLAGLNPPSSSGLGSPGQLMSSLSELIRSTQDRNAKTVADTQRAVQQVAQQAQQQTGQAAQSAQGGIQSALTEIGQGLQRIASNNPNLVPDVKSLYQSVSSKLSSASSSVAQSVPTNSGIVPAKNGEQLADNLAKVALPGLQIPSSG